MYLSVFQANIKTRTVYCIRYPQGVKTTRKFELKWPSTLKSEIFKKTSLGMLNMTPQSTRSEEDHLNLEDAIQVSSL